MPRARKRRVDRYDGQVIWINGEANYDLGNYLGGGAAGVVYEASNLRSSTDAAKTVAMKILNPVGYKLMSSGPLQRCILAKKGQPLSNNNSTLTSENVWWCVHPSTRVLIAAIPDVRTGMLKELPLPKCIEIWGWDPLNEGTKSGSDEELSGATGGGGHGRRCGSGRNEQDHHHHHSNDSRSNHHHHHNHNFLNDDPNDCGCLSDEAIEKLAKSSGEMVHVDGFNELIDIPKVPIKFIRWLRARQNIYKEIANMAHLGSHPNVVGLLEVLEYIQDSKTTLFLVLEMVTGGELFDRIKIGKGTSEETAKQYFRQLIDGVCYCHTKGVCHRDLKPENLLLADNSDKAVLKIADFGLSAAFAIAAHSGPSSSTTPSPSSSPSEAKNMLGSPPSSPVNIRRLRSVVGSPHYVAPEVTNEPIGGYDGPKADCWSAGVILYAILAGNLPFAKELASCERYAKFKRWVSGHDISTRNSVVHILPLSFNQTDDDENDGATCLTPLEQLNWFFPKHFPESAKGLLVALLHPEPARRPPMDEVCFHEWVRRTVNTSPPSSMSSLPSSRGSAAETAASADEEDMVAQVSAMSMSDVDTGVARALQQSFDDLISRKGPPPPPL